MPGFVYAFVCPSMQGIVKIGATEREVVERLRDANSSDTWRPPEPYVVACYAQVDDPFAVERQIHAALSELRINRRREFFRATEDEVRALIARVAPLGPIGHLENESYEARKARFEARRFKTMTGKLKFHAIDIETGEVTSESKEGFAVAYEDWMRGGRQFLVEWFADPTKRS